MSLLPTGITELKVYLGETHFQNNNIILGPVHTYPDIFENGDFFFSVC